MADFLIKPIPLPIPRPSGVYEEYAPSIASRMPLEATEKLTGAFSEVPRYPPTSHPLELTSGLLIASGSLFVILALLGVYWRKEIWNYIHSRVMNR